jgi:hypothetical protein
MSAAHTPGPWRAIKTPESTYFDDQVQIGRDRVGVYSEADARLIAEAPELLAVLQAVIHSVPFHHSHKDVHDRAVAAIARATGSQA